MPMKPPTVATTAPAFTPTTPAQPAQSATATTAPAASKPDTEGNSPNPFAKTNTQTVSKPAGEVKAFVPGGSVAASPSNQMAKAPFYP